MGRKIVIDEEPVLRKKLKPFFPSAGGFRSGAIYDAVGPTALARISHPRRPGIRAARYSRNFQFRVARLTYKAVQKLLLQDNLEPALREFYS